MKAIKLVLPAAVLLMLITACGQSPNLEERMRYANEIEVSLEAELLAPWYPKAVDKEFGGFLSAFTYDFEPADQQNKMIVSQSRHVWTNAKASQRYPEEEHYLEAARQGFEFLKDKMWDAEFGGFHTMVTRSGEVIPQKPAKTAYGNAFAIYGLATYYEASGDEEALELAKEAFLWLEEHSHDPQYLGYFQHLGRDGTRIRRSADTPSTSDLGYKDQNSSIHLLEAFTELYHVWPDELVAERLEEILVLIRDTIVNEHHSLTLFLQPDWTPVSFRDSSRGVIDEHYYLDHVSFGHDVETAFLMLEASHALGLEDDTITPKKAKQMVDHSLRNGWDAQDGGFYDAGYYFSGDDTLTVIRQTKNWWAQAEGLNALSLMARLHPDDEMKYFEKFKKQWEYIDKYLIDHEHGGWYEGGLDEQPEAKERMKGHIWKTTYHTYRAMAQSIDMLRGKFELLDE
ncbi:AGE family epimerase/isomerase [Gracilimonas mengyeensis]|uniref:Mannobiose 2-epimerase n=1 Tax=Gracilimonas mengyeensis TaxID=1302730 RepID=A0A521FIR4_9BACT|nr:AGE family epimerase/isomerase [Gracilimonas mengyeensis]SMO96112.1 mannobiose 2-epimerase [Gracilimonas mengyeensis]